MQDRELVEFLDPTEWLFGISDASFEQGGIYSRHIIGLRQERVDPKLIQHMHRYFNILSQVSDAKLIGFDTFTGPLWNRLKKIMLQVFDAPVQEKGNCAFWISKGLVRAGLLSTPSIFPKHILIKMLEQHRGHGQSLIYYERVNGGYHRWGEQYHNGHALSIVSLTPSGIYKSIKYRNLHRRADYIVSVHALDEKAHLIDGRMVPKEWMRGVFG